jgi:hypothetical protein
VNTVDGVNFSASQGSAVVTSDFVATTPPNGLGSTSFGFFASTESATISFATASGDYIAAPDVVRLSLAGLFILGARGSVTFLDSLPIRHSRA